MRKLSILILSVLLIASLAPAVLAEPKPGAEYIPQPVDPDPGFAFEDWWIELNPDEGGDGIELPGGDDWVRGGPGALSVHGVPIGFNFKYMQGPAVGDPVFDPFGNIVDWVVSLSNNGYNEAFVATNGYIVFSDPRPFGDLGGLGAHHYWEPAGGFPSVEVPNNFISPYWSDWMIVDNDFHEVTEVCFVCTMWDDGGACIGGFYRPCEWRTVHRPRGRLLYQTVGEEPNRKFVVQWANAKQYWSGNLATFQLQLWEGSNGILFLYKDFMVKGLWEDPPHEYPFVIQFHALVGMEDFYGTTGVGWLYLGERTESEIFDPFGFWPFVGWWELFNPLDELTTMAFVPDAYAGVRPFVP